MGPLEVLSPAGWTAIGAAKWRSLLACLLLRPGQLVSTESLIFELWGDTPPSTANNLVSIYVHRLRKVIGDTEGRVLAYHAPGYLLRVTSGDLDIQEFESLLADGRAALAAADPQRAATLLADALGLWRGPLLADVHQTTLVTTQADRASELWLTAVELRVQADLGCGRPAAVIPELHGLVAEHPLREGLWALFIRALDEAGRHAEALDAYARARQVISDELGVEPGAELQQLYAALLAADTAPPSRRTGTGAAQAVPPATTERAGQAVADATDAPDGASAVAGTAGGATASGRGTGYGGHADDAGSADAAAGTSPAPGEAPGMIALGTFSDLGPPLAAHAAIDEPAEVRSAPWAAPPAQLPADIGYFTGREAQVAYLCRLLLRGDETSNPGAVRIAVVNGAAGLGKTALAVHAAHRVRAEFPDGQLYVDLLGASGQAAAPGEVLARFLRDLGVDGDRVPVGDEERAALYRTRLTGRRVLVLLDNARDAAQVRSLLPGSSSCAVLVTTRNRAADLASTWFVDLNVLADTEALALFSRVVGERRSAAEPDATAEILVACAGLPLAIRICAARLAARRQWRIATLAARLRDERRRLDELKTGDLEVRASFQVSYDSLLTGTRRGADQARAFRLLGLWQGQTIGLPAAAALLGQAEDDVATALESLVDANLIESPGPDRYRFHDLLRFFATERAEREEPAADRTAAVARLLRWYLAAADSGAQVLSPHRYRLPLDHEPDVTPLRPASGEEALRWYDEERANLIAAIRQAAAVGLDDVAWWLAATLYIAFNRRDNWADCAIANRTGVESARRAGHRQGEAWALQNLGQALARMRDPEALGALEQALRIRREVGDRAGEAQTAISLADAYHKLRGPQAALKHSLRCLDVLREVGNPQLLAIGLNNHGEFCLEVGQLDEAVGFFTQALDISKEIGGYPHGHTLHNLGRVLLETGRPDEAITTLAESHRIHQSAGDLKGQAIALKYLGEARRVIGDREQARQAWLEALALFKRLKADNEVADISSALDALAA